MANVLATDKKIAIISALTEGSSIRSIERMTGVHRDTIMRLGVKVGQGCTAMMDATMRDLSCNRLEMDEIWGFVGKKDRNVKMGDVPIVGSVWTFCAIDAETKLVPAFKVGQRDAATADAFIADVASRMRNRVQISTDGLRAYVQAVERAFHNEVDYAQIIKIYGKEPATDRRYSTADVIGTEKMAVFGHPDMDLCSTSYVERLNATTRLHMRRLTRLYPCVQQEVGQLRSCGRIALRLLQLRQTAQHTTLHPGDGCGCRYQDVEHRRACGGRVSDIEELSELILRMHNAEATHVKSVPVKERFNGQVVWDGTVEVFKLHNHPKAKHVYAWSHETDDPDNPKRHVTVLHMGPITSPQLAVRAAIVQEYRAGIQA